MLSIVAAQKELIQPRTLLAGERIAVSFARREVRQMIESHVRYGIVCLLLIAVRRMIVESCGVGVAVDATFISRADTGGKKSGMPTS